MLCLDAIKSRLRQGTRPASAPADVKTATQTTTQQEYYARKLQATIDALNNPSSSPTSPSSLHTRMSADAASPPRRMTTPRQKFPADQLRPWMRQLLNTTLATAKWDGNDRARMGAYSKEICERVKKRMLEIEPTGFKYIASATFTENLGQAGRADMACHWEDTDVAIQEIFSNDTIIFVCIAYAVRVI